MERTDGDQAAGVVLQPRLVEIAAVALRTLMALCDILECTPNDLIEPVAEPRRARRAATAAGTGEASVTALKGRRPRRAEIHKP
ncbi:MAG: helix-turn-helix domain-containing protein [Acidimicrobiales bacterium]